MSLTIVRNDITHMAVNAIVNTANRHVGYSRGTDSAVYHAAGVEKLMAARGKIGEMRPGQVAITEGFDLPADYIIHVVGTPWRGGEEGELDIIKSCYSKSLQCAYDMQCSSIAIPLLASGNFGLPKELALPLAMGEIRRFLAEHEMDVYLVLFDEEAVTLTKDMFGQLEEYVDNNYVDMVREAEMCEALYDNSIVEDACYNAPIDGANQVQAQPMASAPAAPLPQAKEPKKQKKPFLFGWRTSKENKSEKQRQLDELQKQVSENFADKLQRLIDERGYENPWVYDRACMSKQTFNKIINNQSVPKKNTAIILAITLGLNLDETTDLLARAGHALSPSSLSDTIVKYFIENEIYDWDEIDAAFIHFHLTPMIS